MLPKVTPGAPPTATVPRKTSAGIRASHLFGRWTPQRPLGCSLGAISDAESEERWEEELVIHLRVDGVFAAYYIDFS